MRRRDSGRRVPCRQLAEPTKPLCGCWGRAVGPGPGVRPGNLGADQQTQSRVEQVIKRLERDSFESIE